MCVVCYEVVAMKELKEDAPAGDSRVGVISAEDAMCMDRSDAAACGLYALRGHFELQLYDAVGR